MNVQYWDGTDPESAGNFADDLDATNASQARYCLSYTNRLILADIYDNDTSARNPWRLRTSANGDPSDFTDSTAVDIDFVENQEPICGLGISGGQLIVYKKAMYYVGYPTGTAEDPLTFPKAMPGIGLYAPYSLVQCLGVSAWMGIDDFYMLNGDTATSIGASIRHHFFSIMSDDQKARVLGFNAPKYNEIIWVAETSEGPVNLAWNYKENAWFMYTFDEALTSLGGYGF